MSFFWAVLNGLLMICTTSVLVLLVYIVACRMKFRRRAPKRKRPKVIAFFHPYCSAGGGGERVLWKAIQVLGDLHEEGLPLEVFIYTIDEPKASYKEGTCLVSVDAGFCVVAHILACLLVDLLQHVQARFSISPLSSLPLTFVHLQSHAHYLGTTLCVRMSLALVYLEL